MRLINTETLELEEFQNNSIPRYAVLSHTWEEDEVSFVEMRRDLKPMQKRGYSKVLSACHQARKDSLSHLWLDTCCIDKRSSAELQEAINSMFKFYKDAKICYALLSDMSERCPVLEDRSPDEQRSNTWHRLFVQSRWFSRGWTLQELIAPADVKFFGQAWNFIATKAGLIQTISAATGIQSSILAQTARVSSVSVAQRMSWAAHRQTSRLEDQAYSLLGIFNVNMPMLYGEGSKAFIRLQEEILKVSTDHSIFAWEFGEGSPADGTLLAASPANFAECKRIVQWGKPGAFEMTNRGLRISLPTFTTVTYYTETLAVLNCRYANDLSGTLALRLRTYGGGEEYYAMLGDVPPQPSLVPRARRRQNSRLAFILEQDIPNEDAPTLRITREFEPEASKLKFWIPLSSSSFRVVEVYPEENWDTADGIMHAGDGERVRCGVVLETAYGSKFAIAFGFDMAQESLLDETKKGFLPGIWTFSHSALESFPDAVRRYRTECDHESCLWQGCPFMPSSNIWHQSEQNEKINSRIYKATMMQETVFVVVVEVGQVYELETAESFTELEAIEVPAQRADLVSKLSSKPYVPSALPPLSHLLADWEKNVPCQVWMRSFSELSVIEIYPSTARLLPSDVQFWPLMNTEFVTGGIQFAYPGVAGLVLIFAGRKGMDWKILFTQLSNDYATLSSLCQTVRRRVEAAKAPASENGKRTGYWTHAVAQFPLPREGTRDAVLWAELRRPGPGEVYTIDLQLIYNEVEETVKVADESADHKPQYETTTHPGTFSAGNVSWNLAPSARDSSFQTSAV